ncbi:uncharacterized protein A4U43_C05F460 [Asparagus officinalis]|uniref:Uncharacterized protein n=1 Tax=Asparagus officinalis TaxID=4686 RepID=A0A5P1EQS4_ASPOF|nr:uncharacterized protein A4U43_C05F460 [Asparagus officinalis]
MLYTSKEFTTDTTTSANYQKKSQRPKRLHNHKNLLKFVHIRPVELSSSQKIFYQGQMDSTENFPSPIGSSTKPISSFFSFTVGFSSAPVAPLRQFHDEHLSDGEQLSDGERLMAACKSKFAWSGWRSSEKRRTRVAIGKKTLRGVLSVEICLSTVIVFVCINKRDEMLFS